MRRFWSDLNTLGGLSRVNRKRTALGVLLAYLILNQYWGLQLFKAEDAAPAPIEGPMAPYRVQEAAAPPPCRAPGCTFDGGVAGLVRQRVVLPVELELPGVEEFHAPPGKVMVPEADESPPWLTYDPYGGYARKLPMLYQPRGQPPAARADEQQRVQVPWQGLVAEARVAGSGKRVLANGNVLDAQGRPAAWEPRPALDLLRMQPLPSVVRARAVGGWASPPRTGREFLVLLNWPASDMVDAEGPTGLPRGLTASVEAVDASDPTQPRLKLSIGWSQTFSRHLAGLAPGQRAAGQPMLPTRVGLVDALGPSVAVHVVPTAAVERDDQGERVWVAVGGHAVPVTVRVHGRQSERAWVSEQPRERNRPVRAADWRAMGEHARAAVYRARKPGTPGGHALLAAQDVRVILRPGGGLRPGQPVATRGGSGA